MRAAVIIIAFNDARLIAKQLQLIDKFCAEKPDIIVFDNSNISSVRIPLKENHIYYGFSGYYLNPSDSHSTAANEAYRVFSPYYDKLLFLDHDCFPIKYFSITGMLNGSVISGLGQQKSKVYFWPGCVAFDVKQLNGFSVDFSTNQELGLDTGGNLFHVFDKYLGVCLNEKSYPNPYFQDELYNFYNTIYNDTFMHFTNASNWNKNPLNDQRLETLYRILEEKTT